MSAGVQYVALLRGINVGGKNLIKMADLRVAFEEMGFTEVATFIASGNVLFRAPRQRREQLARQLESALTARFGVELKVVVLTEAQLRAVVVGAPPGAGGKSHLWDVVFVRKPLTARKAFAAVELREGVDRAWAGKGVVYLSRLAARATSSRINKIASTPEYQDMTIRNWNTTEKLLALMQEPPSPVGHSSAPRATRSRKPREPGAGP